MLKAITLRQPWAYAVIVLGNDMVNRPWFHSSLVGAELAIAAGRRYDDEGRRFITVDLGLYVPDELPMGSIVGTVTVGEAHNSAACVRTGPLAHLHPDGNFTCSRWGMGGATGHGPMMHWKLSGPRACRPVLCSGQQKASEMVWVVPDHIESWVRQTLESHAT